MIDDSTATASDDVRPSVGRALALLDLFTVEAPSWTAERICEERRLSLPTGYRYIRELVAAGLLVRGSGGHYSLGPRIIALDYTIRQSDPLLRVAVPVMKDLVRRTGCACVISTLLGDQILDTHREAGAEPLALAYGRGRSRPMFYGAAPKVILADQPANWLHRLYDARAGEIAAAGMGDDWTPFRRGLAEIRRRGFYVSRGELEADLSAVAAPIRMAAEDTQSAVALVTASERFDLLDAAQLAALVRRGGEAIAAAMASERGDRREAPLD
ncbi:MAG: IclR family transcriptional regulator C-terminal domain-containing protein [Xanthobacteraceae bacterium]|nr:IclR family transcriptional regulator C-terminal domain-containing protein [Xanthobacteraceae bacterium]